MTELYKKLRPKDYKEVLGQEQAVNILTKFVMKNGVPHTLLFTGPSGCGKTTLARITARKVDCGEHDLLEINVADYRGIDTIREIRARMSQRPLSGKSKVWLLDEVHQLRAEPQNALLKMLEDTPEHVYFMLCTTDPGKLIRTLKNRCTEIKVQPLTSSHLTTLIKQTCKKENVTLKQRVRDAIIEAADGSARKAMVILNTILPIENWKKQLAAINAEDAEQQAINIARELCSRGPVNWKKVASIIKSCDEDPEQIRRLILGYANTVLLNSGSVRAFQIIECFQTPFYDIGKPGLTGSAFQVFLASKSTRKSG